MSTPRPSVTPPGPWRQPLPDVQVLDNGLRVCTIDVPGQQVASVRLALPATLADEPVGREGAVAMMARLLDEGCRGHTAEEFALALERRGIVLGAGAVDGGVSVDLDVPVRRLPEALELLTLAVTEPTFPADQVDRILHSRLAEIDHESASAPHRAARELARTLWAPGSRAATPIGGTKASIEALTRADLVTRHTRLGAQGATLVLAGQFSGRAADLTSGRGADAEVVAAVQATLGQWSSVPECAPALAPTPAPDLARIVLVDRPGSVQSEIVVAAPAPGRADPRWPAFPVVTYLLGGAPTARIDAVLREELGWTYGIRCSMRPRAAGGSVVTSGSVRADVTAPALARLVDLLSPSGPDFSATELSAGVDFITGATPGRWATADVIADEMASLALEGLPWDFPQQTVQAMHALTAADLRDAWESLTQVGWSVVVVGDAASQADNLTALGLGPVTIVSD